MRAASRSVLAAVALSACLTGCGTAAGPPPGPRVILKVTSPTDGTRLSSDRTTVAGTVSPARAEVTVLGQRVRVSAAGRFSTPVALSVGPNLIDVIASAPRSAGALSAIRVTRFLLVTVPGLAGKSPAQAGAILRALGLEVHIQASANPLNFLIPATARVCSSAPAAGVRVSPGSAVTLSVSKLCGF